MRKPESYDIFCRVVDNFGDAAVCWRLARVLALEHAARVRLWIDDTAPLEQLVPELRATRRFDGVQVSRWTDSPDSRSDVAIDAFGGGLPYAYVETALARPPRPLWIVLEYLSAEPWVAEHHGLPSPHPHHACDRYFFFPGFTSHTGGVLRERDLIDRRDAFGKANRAAFWSDHGFGMPPDDALVVSLFAYEHAPVEALLACWSRGKERVIAAVPEGPLLERACSWGAQGKLELRALPFLPQARYDEFLWACDMNFVRGEDSFVRAQWAAKPFAWHVYPQAEGAHHRKLDAFLGLYTDQLPAAAASAIARLMRAWNGDDAALGAAWADVMAQRHALDMHAEAWAMRLASVGDLAANLAKFCAAKLK